MKQMLIVLILIVASMSTAGTTFAADVETDHCTHESTVAALRTCIEHAAHHGFIDNIGVTRSLLAKLDSAQAALERGQTQVATAQLQALIYEVRAQADNHIAQPHAGHLLDHAAMVLAALEG